MTNSFTLHFLFASALEVGITHTEAELATFLQSHVSKSVWQNAFSLKELLRSVVKNGVKKPQRDLLIH